MPNVDNMAAARGPMGGWRNVMITLPALFSAREAGIPYGASEHEHREEVTAILPQKPSP